VTVTVIVGSEVWRGVASVRARLLRRDRRIVEFFIVGLLCSIMVCALCCVIFSSWVELYSFRPWSVEVEEEDM
jgi:hypothetical protein